METVPEAMMRLQQTAGLATTFVSGPSATADIEMTRNQRGSWSAISGCCCDCLKREKNLLTNGNAKAQSAYVSIESIFLFL